MYLYQITNLVNGKLYIGQTNNITKRWSNHKCNNSPDMAIAKAIQKYGVENFKFEVLYRNVPIEEIDELEIRIIKEKNSRVPNGYNVAAGGEGNRGVSKFGADNSNAHLTQEEAQWVLDNRNQPIYVLYSNFSDKITYNTFKKIYHHQTYTNLHTDTKEYPYNFEFSNQFQKNGFEYDEVVELRERYQKGEYWADIYKEYKNRIDEWSFWAIYTGRRYKLVMPEIFTEELQKLHSSLGKSGEKNGRAKLTEKEVRQIRRLHNEGISNSELYKMYNQISSTSIQNIINGLTWKNLL